MGFVLAEHYGCVRATADVDVIESLGTDKGSIARLAGRGSALHKRHRVFIDIATVADVPDDYDTRLIPMQVDGLVRIRLRAFERHDLVLAKLCRNIERDLATLQHVLGDRAKHGFFPHLEAQGIHLSQQAALGVSGSGHRRRKSAAVPAERRPTGSAWR